MKTEQSQFLNLRRLPGRVTAEEASWVLGVALSDISILVANKLLQPLGKPAPNAVRYFASSELEERRADKSWLDKACAALGRHWRTRNECLRKKSTPAVTVSAR